MMQICIGCICWVFLQYVFLSVSSECLPGMMQSYNGCICCAFLQCVFSNVPLSHLHGMMQICIGCICRAFLQYEFSSESSDCQPVRLQNYIDNIYAFLHVIVKHLDHWMKTYAGWICSDLHFVVSRASAKFLLRLLQSGIDYIVQFYRLLVQFCKALYKVTFETLCLVQWLHQTGTKIDMAFSCRVKLKVKVPENH